MVTLFFFQIVSKLYNLIELLVRDSKCIQSLTVADDRFRALRLWFLLILPF